MTGTDRFRFAIVLALASVAAFPIAARDPALPYRLSVSVEWGQPLGPESFRDALRRQLVLEITAKRCFRSVQERPPESPTADDLSLRLFVDGFREETEFEVGIAERNDPQYDTGRKMIAWLDADFHAQVQAPGGERPVREQAFHRKSSWRPLYREDPRQQVQLKMIETVARATRKFVCKGSPAAWAKQVAEAGGQPTR